MPLSHHVTCETKNEYFTRITADHKTILALETIIQVGPPWPSTLGIWPVQNEGVCQTKSGHFRLFCLALLPALASDPSLPNCGLSPKLVCQSQPGCWSPAPLAQPQVFLLGDSQPSGFSWLKHLWSIRRWTTDVARQGIVGLERFILYQLCLLNICANSPSSPYLWHSEFPTNVYETAEFKQYY